MQLKFFEISGESLKSFELLYVTHHQLERLRRFLNAASVLSHVKFRNVGSHVRKEKLTTLNYISIAKLLLDRAQTGITLSVTPLQAK